jgi:hypothetical protein
MVNFHVCIISIPILEVRQYWTTRAALHSETSSIVQSQCILHLTSQKRKIILHSDILLSIAIKNGSVLPVILKELAKVVLVSYFFPTHCLEVSEGKPAANGGNAGNNQVFVRRI